MRNKLAILFAIAFIGLGRPGNAFGQANQPAPSSVIELPYPYEIGSTYEVTKVDPGGTARSSQSALRPRATGTRPGDCQTDEGCSRHAKPNGSSRRCPRATT